jgi:hypothetical protein
MMMGDSMSIFKRRLVLRDVNASAARSSRVQFRIRTFTGMRERLNSNAIFDPLSRGVRA